MFVFKTEGQAIIAAALINAKRGNGMGGENGGGMRFDLAKPPCGPFLWRDAHGPHAGRLNEEMHWSYTQAASVLLVGGQLFIPVRSMSVASSAWIGRDKKYPCALSQFRLVR